MNKGVNILALFNCMIRFGRAIEYRKITTLRSGEKKKKEKKKKVEVDYYTMNRRKTTRFR